MRNTAKKCSIFLLTLLLIVQIPVLTSASEIVTDTGNYTVFTEDNESDKTADIVKEYCKGASTKMSFRGKLIQVYCPKKSTTYIYRVKNMPSNGRITKVSSSNGKVAKISIGDNNVRIKPLKAGKSTIKVTVKTGRLLTTFTSQLTVYKWSNPVANYKIGNKQIKNQFKNTNIYNYKLGSKKTLKFDVKAKTGWKMTSFTYYDKLGKSTSYLSSSKKIKLEKGGSVQINFTNQKTGLVENVVIWIK